MLWQNEHSHTGFSSSIGGDTLTSRPSPNYISLLSSSSLLQDDSSSMLSITGRFRRAGAAYLRSSSILTLGEGSSGCYLLLLPDLPILAPILLVG